MLFFAVRRVSYSFLPHDCFSLCVVPRMMCCVAMRSVPTVWDILACVLVTLQKCMNAYWELTFWLFCIWVKHFLVLVNSNFLVFLFPSCSKFFVVAPTPTPHTQVFLRVGYSSIYFVFPKHFIRHCKCFYLSTSPHHPQQRMLHSPSHSSRPQAVGFGHHSQHHVPAQVREEASAVWRGVRIGQSPHSSDKARLYSEVLDLFAFMCLHRGLIMCPCCSVLCLNVP